MSDDSSSWIESSYPATHDIPVRVRPGPTPSAPLVVLCHGMGETPEIAAAAWTRVLALPVHAVLPAGPYPLEVRTDDAIRIGYAWYLYDGQPEPFRTTIQTSASRLRDLLGDVEQRNGMIPRRRALLGFSQGAYFGYVAALSNMDYFSHLVAVAGRLNESFVASYLESGGDLKTLILHGDQDRAVSPEAAERSRLALSSAGFVVQIASLPLGHRIGAAGDEAACRWLSENGFGR